jgi:hypothetical protein
MPIKFFEHVTASLPVGYFSDLKISRNRQHLEQCPLSHIVQIHSTVFRSDTLSGQGTKGLKYTFTLNTHMRVEKESPFVTLEFGCEPFDLSTSVEVMDALLAPGPHDSPEFEELAIKSRRLSLHAKLVNLSPRLLGTLSSIIPASEVYLSFDERFSEYMNGWKYRQKMLCSYARPFLDGTLMSESVHLCLNEYRDYISGDDAESAVSDDSYEYEGRSDAVNSNGDDEFARWAERAMTPCISTTLCRFNVSYLYHGIQREFCIKWWDKVLFPAVVLNHYCKRLDQPMDRRILPFAISSINKGSVYFK